MNIDDLYKDLLQQVNETPISSIDIERTCATINNIHKNLSTAHAKQHYEIIGALIIHHANITGALSLSHFPYENQTMPGNSGILNSISDSSSSIPPILQCIIAQYIEINSVK